MAERRARRDAARALTRDIPDPETYARYAPLVVADALCGAVRLGGPGSIGVYRVAEGHARILRPLGLCEFGGTCLTAFGLGVRRALMREDG